MDIRQALKLASGCGFIWVIGAFLRGLGEDLSLRSIQYVGDAALLTGLLLAAILGYFIYKEGEE